MRLFLFLQNNVAKAYPQRRARASHNQQLYALHLCYKNTIHSLRDKKNSLQKNINSIPFGK
jgi:hypothetical protein